MKKAKGSPLLSLPPRVRYADFAPFEPGEVIGPQWSESRLLLLTLRGLGTVEVQGRRFSLSAEQVACVPWATPLRYSAHAKDPFTLIGVHFVHLPWNAPSLDLPPHFSYAVNLEHGRYGVPPHPKFFTEVFMFNLPGRSSIPETAIEIVKTLGGGLATLSRESFACVDSC